MNIKPLIDTTNTDRTDRLAACRADVISLRERLRITAQILVDAIGASGPENADDLARIAAEEVARLREVSKEYIHALAVIRAENDRYRDALVAIVDFEKQHLRRFSDAEQIASHALANRTESGPLSDDSGPIAGAGK